MKNRHTSPFRWHLLVISAFIATMAIVAGCGNLQGTDVGSGGTGDVGSNQTHTDTGSGGTSDNGTALTLQSTMSRETNVSASGNEVAAVVLGNTTFALNALLRNPADTNTLFSPYSITTAFALLAPGTAGTTLYGIEQALSFPLAQNRFNPTLNKLEALLAAETNGAIMSNGASLPKLSTANAVWAQKDLTILTSYLDTLAVNYGAGVHIVDFAHASENSRLAINSWTSEATHEKIADLIPTGGIDAFTRFVLTNAIWFKSNWSLPFPVATTRDRSFTNRDASQSTVPFMSQKLEISYVQAYGCQAVDIPYAGNNISMLVIMPEAGTLDTFMAALKPATISTITAGLSTNYVDFALPKFSLRQKSDLQTMLQSLGMTDVFDFARADLSGIDGMHDLVVKRVFHEAAISVDEQGTEATAATAVIGGVHSSLITPPEPVAVTIDHPFLFLIRERQTGVVLFIGKVVQL